MWNYQFYAALLWPSKYTFPSLIYMYIVLIKCFQVVFTWIFSVYIWTFRQVCIPRKYKWKGIFHCIPQEHCISILYHAIEYKVANTINATCMWSMMGRLYLSIYNSFPVFGLTLFSYGIAQKKFLSCNKRVWNCWKHHHLITSSVILV